MSQLPKITVITPSLNQGRYLERAICSVLDQGYENLEYVVIDGGSEDESVPLISHYDDGIAYWQSRPDHGPADAINQALARATGDYVLIVPADSMLLPGALHEAAAKLADGGDWYVGHCQRVDMDDEPVGRWAAEKATTLAAHLSQEAGFLPLEGSFFKAGVLERYGAFDVEMRFAFGFEVSCRLLAAGVKPELMGIDVTAHRQQRRGRTVAHLVQEGREHIAAAERYASMLQMHDRNALWEACDERRRIYELAEGESGESDARRFLWQQLIKRPWWLASARYRSSLLRGVSSPQGEMPMRKAA